MLWIHETASGRVAILLCLCRDSGSKAYIRDAGIEPYTKTYPIDHSKI